MHALESKNIPFKYNDIKNCKIYSCIHPFTHKETKIAIINKKSFKCVNFFSEAHVRMEFIKKNY